MRLKHGEFFGDMARQRRREELHTSILYSNHPRRNRDLDTPSEQPDDIMRPSTHPKTSGIRILMKTSPHSPTSTVEFSARRISIYPNLHNPARHELERD